MRQLASGMRQLAGTKTRYRRAHAAPLAGLISGRVECKTNSLSPKGAKGSCPACALSGLSGSRLPVSWGDAPGFHMEPRCGKILRTPQPGDGTKTGSTNHPNNPTFAQATHTLLA